MKAFDKVAIVCDTSLLSLASTLRAFLEQMCLQVHLHHLVEHQQAIAFFADEACRYKYLVLCCHATGIEESEMMIQIDVSKKQDDNPECNDGWEGVTVELSPSNIPQLLRNFQGHLLSIGCGSGREQFGRAFLAAGCQTYIAPEELCFSRESALLFVIGFFYHLCAEDRQFDGAKLEVAEAATLAQILDPRFAMGTRSFRIYSHS